MNSRLNESDCLVSKPKNVHSWETLPSVRLFYFYVLDLISLFVAELRVSRLNYRCLVAMEAAEINKHLIGTQLVSTYFMPQLHAESVVTTINRHSFTISIRFDLTIKLCYVEKQIITSWHYYSRIRRRGEGTIFRGVCLFIFQGVPLSALPDRGGVSSAHPS